MQVLLHILCKHFIAGVVDLLDGGHVFAFILKQKLDFVFENIVMAIEIFFHPQTNILHPLVDSQLLF